MSSPNWNLNSHEFDFEYEQFSRNMIKVTTHNVTLCISTRLFFKKNINDKYEIKFTRNECNPNRVVNNFTNKLINLLKRNNIIDIDTTSNSEKFIISLKPHILLNIL